MKSESSMVLATAMRAGGRISVRRSLQPPPPQQKQQQVSSLEPPKEAEEEAVSPPPTYAELQRTPGTPPPPAYALLQVDAALEQAALSPSAVPTPIFQVSPKSSPALVPAELQQVQLAIDELHDEAVAATSPKPQKKPPKPKKPVRSPPGGLAATYPAPSSSSSSSSSSTGSDAGSGLLSNTMSSPSSSSAVGPSPSSRPKVLSARTESFHKLLLTAQQNLAAARKATEE